MKTYLLTVTGLVQGVGMRPFVCNLGRTLGLDGLVRNSGGVLEIEVNLSWAVEDFIHRLYKLCPEKAVIKSIVYKELPFKEYKGFTVDISNDNDIIPALPKDIGICESCRQALTNPKDRRFHYPFITCTSCGPRYTVMTDIPYDRSRTTMECFTMCEECRKEYYNPDSRFFYAQTLSCPSCGPKLYFYNTDCASEKIYGPEAFEACVKALADGYVVAVKNIGGFHLVCDALNNAAVKTLRGFKERRKKPLAVCFKDVQTVAKYAEVSEAAKTLLQGDERPIVLLERLGNRLPREVCENSDKLGAMLPAGGLQYMLTERFEALVMTSANLSSEPMIIDDSELEGFKSLYVLSNDRAILTPVDDSIIQFKAGKPCIVRRGRGYVPEAIETGISLPKVALFTGADMKGSVGLAKENKLFLSQCLGDMSHDRVLSEAKKTANRLEINHKLKHEVVVSDAHPGYYSSGLYEPDELLFHHRAHAMSVLLEHRLLEDEALVFAIDGTGYGEDGNIWGSEAFMYSKGELKRVSSLKPEKLCGGDAASRDGRLVLASLALNEDDLDLSKMDVFRSILDKSGLASQEIELCKRAIEHNVGTYVSTSLGRLFDAVSALLGICVESTYEGEAAIELEYAARKVIREENTCGFCSEYKALLVDGRLDSRRVLSYLYEKLEAGDNEYRLAMEFHEIVAYWMVEVARLNNAKKLAISGGCAANSLLVEILATELKRRRIDFYFNELLPPGDDGIIAGQLALYYLMTKEDK